MQHTKKNSATTPTEANKMCARARARELIIGLKNCRVAFLVVVCVCVCVGLCCGSLSTRFGVCSAAERLSKPLRSADQECVNVFCCCWRLRFFCGIAGVHSCHATMVACVSGAKCSIHLDWVRCNYVWGHSFLAATAAATRRSCTRTIMHLRAN